MITYTGLVSLATHYMPWGIAANYADEGKFFEATAPWPVPGEKTGPAPPAPIRPIAEPAERRWGGAAGSVRSLHPGDRSAPVSASSASAAGLALSLGYHHHVAATDTPYGRHDPVVYRSRTEETRTRRHAG